MFVSFTLRRPSSFLSASSLSASKYMTVPDMIADASSTPTMTVDISRQLAMARRATCGHAVTSLDIRRATYSPSKRAISCSFTRVTERASHSSAPTKMAHIAA